MAASAGAGAGAGAGVTPATPSYRTLPADSAMASNVVNAGSNGSPLTAIALGGGPHGRLVGSAASLPLPGGATTSAGVGSTGGVGTSTDAWVPVVGGQGALQVGGVPLEQLLHS